MGKFTIVTEETESTQSQIGSTINASKEERTPRASDSVDEQFTLEVKQPKRRGRPPGSKAEKFVANAAENPANYALWSQVIIGSANTVAVTWLGNECAMEKREAEMIEPPLSRMLARMPVSASQKVSVFIDPMVILIALGMWGNRIIRVQKEKRGNGITQSEFERASGIDRSSSLVDSYGTRGTEPTGSVQIQQPSTRDTGYATIEADIPRSNVTVHPNGVPVAISEQMGDL